MAVAVVRLDVPRAALVRDTADCAHERRGVGPRRDAEEVPRLEVDRHLHRKPRVPVEPLVRCHMTKRIHIRPFWVPHAPLTARGSVRAMLLSSLTGLGKTVLLIVAI